MACLLGFEMKHQNTHMFKNYLVVAFRNFRRNKIFSIINIMGLSIGICASLVIFQIVHHAFSFDRFEETGNRIFRIVSDYAFQSEPGHTRGIPAPLAGEVTKELSGIDNLVSFRYYNPEKITIPTASIRKIHVVQRAKAYHFCRCPLF